MTKQINSSTKRHESVTTRSEQSGIQLEDEVPTINKIKMQFMRHMTHYHKSIKLQDRIEYLNDHQDDLDKYANQFRALGNYKGDILDAQQKA